MTLAFDPATHAYTVDGAPWPYVTGILEAMGASDYSMVPPDVLAVAAERGRLVHQACHYDDQGDLDETTLDPALVPYVHAWRRFREDHDVQPMAALVERPLAHEVLRYCGTPDCPATMGGMRGKPVVIDRKVVAQVQPATGLQLSAYRMLLNTVADTFPTAVGFSTAGRLAVNLHDDGSYTTVWFTEPDDDRTWLALLKGYHWRLRHQLVRAPGSERKDAA